MLRSLSKRLQGKARSAGLMLGRNQLGFAIVDVTGTKPRVVRADECSLPMTLFAGQPTSDTTTALTEAIKELAPEATDRYLPLHVSVPGAAVQVAVLTLDALPKARAQRLDLVRWHFAQLSGSDQAQVCDCEALGVEGDKHLLLGFAMDEAWHGCIVDALTQAGITAWSLNADIYRQYNRFYSYLNKNCEGGALVATTPDAWSLLLWDECGRVRYGGSQWRTGELDDGAEIAAETERRILASAASLPAVTVDRLHVAANEAAPGFVDTFNARLREPCVRLEQEDVEGVDVTLRPGHVTAALAAALQA